MGWLEFNWDLIVRAIWQVLPTTAARCVQQHGRENKHTVVPKKLPTTEYTAGKTTTPWSPRNYQQLNTQQGKQPHRGPQKITNNWTHGRENNHTVVPKKLPTTEHTAGKTTTPWSPRNYLQLNTRQGKQPHRGPQEITNNWTHGRENNHTVVPKKLPTTELTGRTSPLSKLMLILFGMLIFL